MRRTHVWLVEVTTDDTAFVEVYAREASARRRVRIIARQAAREGDMNLAAVAMRAPVRSAAATD